MAQSIRTLAFICLTALFLVSCVEGNNERTEDRNMSGSAHNMQQEDMMPMMSQGMHSHHGNRSPPHQGNMPPHLQQENPMMHQNMMGPGGPQRPYPPPSNYPYGRPPPMMGPGMPPFPPHLRGPLPMHLRYGPQGGMPQMPQMPQMPPHNSQGGMGHLPRNEMPPHSQGGMPPRSQGMQHHHQDQMQQRHPQGGMPHNPYEEMPHHRQPGMLPQEQMPMHHRPPSGCMPPQHNGGMPPHHGGIPPHHGGIPPHHGGMPPHVHHGAETQPQGGIPPQTPVKR